LALGRVTTASTYADWGSTRNQSNHCHGTIDGNLPKNKKSEDCILRNEDELKTICTFIKNNTKDEIREWGGILSPFRKKKAKGMKKDHRRNGTGNT